MSISISYFRKKGDSYVFATALGLVVSLGMVAWIVGIILVKGLGFFWPRDLRQVTLKDGTVYLGEFWEEHTDFITDAQGQELRDEQFQLKIGNRDIYGRDFVWIHRADVVGEEHPLQAVTIERMEYGNFYGYIRSLQWDSLQVSADEAGFAEKLAGAFAAAHRNKSALDALQREITRLTEPLTRLHREISLLEIEPEAATPAGQQKLSALRQRATRLEEEIAPAYLRLNEELERLTILDRALTITVETADGQSKTLYLSQIVRYFYPNRMGAVQKVGHYLGKVWEFLSAEPRESNTEGGIFPAIFGTVMMVLLMSIAVVPFGVLAAIYLNEYARQGTIIRLIRLSVNNLAGVPSIVFGVFGLGFFIYMVGGSIDQLFFSDRLPEPTFGTGGILWASLTLALLTLPVVVVATEEGLLAVPRANKEGALALGATKWQMIRKIVLPNAMPGILTGLILAISRGAGEVAPLMITGVVKLAPTLPLDTEFPFFHLDRKFMHLGFHIYDVGFQSPNVEAAKPMVYSTALLLIVLVVLLNLTAIFFRNRLRRKLKGATF
ncbi:MAG: phosphate ABC transporter permease PstA [Calditrichaeota bacterium]|nr:MAG: phosphate ABC transporter permease PstA [Calditrichota bacterium]